jgi:hypothetical protein
MTGTAGPIGYHRLGPREYAPRVWIAGLDLTYHEDPDFWARVILDRLAKRSSPERPLIRPIRHIRLPVGGGTGPLAGTTRPFDMTSLNFYSCSRRFGVTRPAW